MNRDGRLHTMERDFGPTCDVELPATEHLALSGNLVTAIEQLMALEKQTRNSGDIESNGRVLVHIVQLCFKTQSWAFLNEHIVTLTKKNGAIKQAHQRMIQAALSFVEDVTDLAARKQLLQTLRSVTEGKLHVEVERAKLTMMLSKMTEAAGNVAEAGEILQEIQIETLGDGMTKREKTEYLLEQMRLALAKNDFMRALVVSRKVSLKYFDDPANHAEDLKLRFCQLMIEHALHKGDYLSVCRNYSRMYNAPSIKDSADRWQEVLTYMAFFAVLSPHSLAQREIINRIVQDSKISRIPALRDFLKLFVTDELISWTAVSAQHESALRTSYVFSETTEDGQRRWKDFKKRVNEQNVRVIAQYYSAISYARLTQLLGLPSLEVEEFVSSLVSSKTIFARIDRPAQVVMFHRPQAPDDLLCEWTEKTRQLLKLLDKTTHLITKEEMLHGLKIMSASDSASNLSLSLAEADENE